MQKKLWLISDNFSRISRPRSHDAGARRGLVSIGHRSSGALHDGHLALGLPAAAAAQPDLLSTPC